MKRSKSFLLLSIAAIGVVVAVAVDGVLSFFGIGSPTTFFTKVTRADTPYSQSGYYGQSGYYSQSTYYSQATYYSQSSYGVVSGEGGSAGCEASGEGAECEGGGSEMSI